MRTAVEAARAGQPPNELVSDGRGSQALLERIVACLEEAKAEEVVAIDLKGKSSLGDFMVIASGRSDRHVGAIGEQVQRNLKESGHGNARVEGLDTCDWVLIDAGDVIVHVFRPEVREFYNLEKMWSGERPADASHH